MCKNMMIAGLRPENEKKLWKFLIAATPFMSTNDKDGIGYAALSDSGIWGERWLHPKDAFKYRNKANERDSEILSRFPGVLENGIKYNHFGVTEAPYAVLFHTRMATCEVNIDNTHPFVSEDGRTALIHNGVADSETIKNVSSSCDSELILRSYMKNEVDKDTVGIHSLAIDVSGSYACGVLSYDKDNNAVMDVFRNSSSILCAAYVKELDAVVFCTNETIVKATCKILKWSMSNAFSFCDNTLARIDAKTGKLVSKHSFVPTNKYANKWSGTNNVNDVYEGFKYAGGWKYSD